MTESAMYFCPAEGCNKIITNDTLYTLCIQNPESVNKCSIVNKINFDFKVPNQLDSFVQQCILSRSTMYSFF